jgi:hypothetical protein
MDRLMLREGLRMFAKIVVLILSMGLLAGALLANRQQRIQAAHDLADAQRRLVEHDRTLWRLRLEIAAQITPVQIETNAKRLGNLQTIRTERYLDMLVRVAEQEGGEAGVGEVTAADPGRDE